MYPRLIILSCLLLTACASNVPLEIRQDISEKEISIGEVRDNAEAYIGDNVRWGGVIAGVENYENDTWIEVVGKKLGSYGQPYYSKHSQGRFIVHLEGFADPEIYRQDRRITIYGEIESQVVRTIDEYPYNYPLVRSKSHYLWDDYYPYHYAYPYPGYYYPYVYPYWYSLHYGHYFGRHSRFGIGFGYHGHHHW